MRSYVRVRLKRLHPKSDPRQGPSHEVCRRARVRRCMRDEASAAGQSCRARCRRRTGEAYAEAAFGLTPDVVLATIRSRYIGGVERCYRRHLKRDASARGRVVVSFTVDPKGRARDGEARGITERVDDCIAAQVARWEFPKPAQEERFALGLELGVD